MQNMTIIFSEIWKIVISNFLAITYISRRVIEEMYRIFNSGNSGLFYRRQADENRRGKSDKNKAACMHNNLNVGNGLTTSF